MTLSNGRFSALLAICVGNSPVTDEFPTQRPVTRSFDLRLNKLLSKQRWSWWFETQSRPLGRHCNINIEVRPLKYTYGIAVFCFGSVVWKFAGDSWSVFAYIHLGFFHDNVNRMVVTIATLADVDKIDRFQNKAHLKCRLICTIIRWLCYTYIWIYTPFYAYQKSYIWIVSIWYRYVKICFYIWHMYLWCIWYDYYFFMWLLCQK